MTAEKAVALHGVELVEFPVIHHAHQAAGLMVAIEAGKSALAHCTANLPATRAREVISIFLNLPLAGSHLLRLLLTESAFFHELLHTLGLGTAGLHFVRLFVFPPTPQPGDLHVLFCRSCEGALTGGVLQPLNFFFVIGPAAVRTDSHCDQYSQRTRSTVLAWRRRNMPPASGENRLAQLPVLHHIGSAGNLNRGPGGGSRHHPKKKIRGRWELQNLG